MSNDVTIEIRADTGDTLLVLAATREAVKALGDTSEASAAQTDTNTKATSRLSGALGFLTGNWKLLLPAVTAGGVALLGFTGNLGVLLPLVPVLTAALAGLIAPFATLAAILVGFIPPITLIIGLLGGLGVAFGLTFMHASNATKGFGRLQDAMAALHSQFGHTLQLLAHAFMPTFLQLIHAASTALSYFGQLSKLDLGAAMRSLSTRGIEMLTHFLDAIGHVIGKPIRLAFEIAFGPQGSARSVTRC